MKRVVLFAAAMAAGLSSFAASAADGDRAPDVVKVKAEPASKKLQQSKKQSQAAKAAKATKAEKAKVSQRKSASAAKRVSVKIDPSKPKAKSRKSRVNLDMTQTASISAAGSGARAYNAIVSRYAAANGVPASLAHAVIRVESNYRADARGSAGEIGLMQIKPDTARMMGYTGSTSGLFHPETNIKYGLKYLGMAHKLGGGNTCGTILRYNAGHAAKRMNPISAAYCSKVKQHLAG